MFPSKMRTKFLSLSLCLSLMLSASGCNMFGAIDDPTEEYELVEQAKALMDAGKCKDAVDLLRGKTGLSDDGNSTNGWAQLCAAGATMTKIGSTVFTFSSGSTNSMAVIGALANKLIPQDASGVTNINGAIGSFGLIQDVTSKNLNLVFGYLVKIGAIMAKYANASGSNSKVERSDIGSDCTATCSTACGADGPTLNNADATDIKNTIVSLAAAAGSVGITLGNISDLTTLLNSTFGALAGNNAIRGQVSCNFLTE